MKCYYELLEIGRDAEDAEIKTAYRKLALKWHPDKNIENTELAKEQFQLVQQAYEVLSDRQERAWYDKHREQILRGSDSDYKDNSLDVFSYFTTQCFKGYGDDKNGFYTVYRTVFEKIAQEDLEYMDSKSEYDEIPGFGTSTSDYNEIVAPFYAYWMGYSTRKCYSWLNPYNINETRERRLLKLIEKENKKIRMKAKKERNDEIRNLVAFVRKRDKRVQTYVKQLEIKNAENRMKQEQLRKQKLMERREEMKEENTSQADWCKFDNVQLELNEIEKKLVEQFSESETDEDDCAVDLYCVACNKFFGNPKAFANHEASKKHKENVAKLKQLMQEEEEEEEEEEELVVVQDNNLEQEEELIVVEDNNVEIQTNDLPIHTNESSKKKNKKKKVINLNEEATNNSFDCNVVETNEVNVNGNKSDDDFDFTTSKKQKKKSKTQKQQQIKTNIQMKNNVQIPENDLSNQKRKKKNRNEMKLEELDVSLYCASCKSIFPSKNKLFDHLKKTGHSIHIPQRKS